MSAAPPAPTPTPPPPPARAAGPSDQFDPDQYRMTIGEHLEELRRRLVIALLGFAVAAVVCLFFGKQVMTYFCAPLIRTLQDYDVNPQIYFTQVSDAFMVFIKISLISAACFSAPWVLYHLWQFVAAGLYPNERKYVTRYVPLSIGLLVSGMLFVYFLVLPWTLQFFLAFSISIPLPEEFKPVTSLATTTTTQPSDVRTVPSLPGDPPEPKDSQIWINEQDGRLKMFFRGQVRVIPFGPQNLTAPMITLPNYIDLVLGMLILFGLSFQLPIVVMTLAKVGIVEIQTLRQSRRVVYFIMVIVAAVITPGDVITATVALLGPLILLYELGIWLGARGKTPELALH